MIRTVRLCATLLIFGMPSIVSATNANPSPSPAPAATPRPLPSTPAGRLLDQFARAWAGITAYDATVTVFEQKGEQVQHLAFDYSFHKPSSATMHVTKGPNAGVTLVWDGGTTVVAHRGSGLFGLFKKTLPLHDALATTIRGSSIDELSFGAILTHAEEAAGTLSVVPGATIDGVATDGVNLVPTAAGADAGLTRETLYLSVTTHLPLRVLGYDGAMLVRQVEFTNVKLVGAPSTP